MNLQSAPSTPASLVAALPSLVLAANNTPGRYSSPVHDGPGARRRRVGDPDLPPLPSSNGGDVRRPMVEYITQFQVL